ncbi:hypothetical protein ACMHYO_14065 [Allopusillimonas ginsengisoli]|uniref:hypothetical protein n=1 Tax=Allopusillimonas ginsengisoli TaxID=453575 RepID=UPI0039C1FBEA
MTTDKHCADFETWVIKEIGDPALLTMRERRFAFLAWQAAIEHARQVCSSPLDVYMAKVQPLIRKDGTISLSDLKNLNLSTNKQDDPARE